MNKEAVKAILEKVFRHEASPEEYSALMEWIRTEQNFETTDLIAELIAVQQPGISVAAEAPYNHEYWDKLCREILSKEIYTVENAVSNDETPVVKVRSRKWYWAAAASVLLLASAASWIWINNSGIRPAEGKSKTPVASDIQPGKNKAILVLADGRNIVLDSAGNGQIAEEDGILVHKNGGKLQYLEAGENEDRSTVFNTLSTPRGAQYQLILPDGTSVWLNAASSIRYPISFPDKERIVEITGEVYFEVKKDPGRPFIVKGAGQEVRVLGTDFNMNVYEDEPLKKITLINGSVQVQELTTQTGSGIPNNGNPVILKPGEQAKVNRADNQMSVTAVDTDEATAWKNGYFYTRNADIRELMRQIGRWFDVEVNLSKLPTEKVKPPTFSGGINRNLTLSQIVKILELSDVNVQIEGRRITILP